MDIVVHVVHVLAALGLVGLVLIQHGKGADAGASFGSGASQTVFGSSGSANFLTRATAFLAVVFFVTSMALAWMAHQQSQTDGSLLPELETVEEEVPAVEESEVPQAPDAAAEVPNAPEVEKEASDVPQAGVESAAPAKNDQSE